MVRDKLNSWDDSGTIIWNDSCNSCHYYYSDWHAGMSCGPASCHVSDRMSNTGTATLHDMGSRTGSTATRTFDPDLVVDMRFENNLNDSGTWRMHGVWSLGRPNPDALDWCEDDPAKRGSYVPGRFGNAIEVDDQPVEVGTRNCYWSTDAGRHGTWKHTEMKYNMTLEAWVYPTDSSGTERRIMAKHTYWDGGYALVLRRVGSSWRAGLLTNVTGGGPNWGDGGWDDADCNGLRGAFSTVPVPLNQWTHVAATYDYAGPDRNPFDHSVGRIRIYVNGEDVTTSYPNESQCYAQPGPGEDIMFPYSDHSPGNESICYNGHWCA
ncbi:MAG: hypothetical protein GTO22_19715, partial [Gemmatimonadales bacterium]|nr:hypothetical protein [Gemmatimonadales bacterium]